ALNDLLDRLLTKGIVLDLDLVIGVAGIPLIGVSLRAAIAAIETMIECGLLQTWDEKTREYAERELQRRKLAYEPGEAPLLEMFGSHWYSDGVYRAWRPGRLFLTDRRLILYRRMPPEILFEVSLARLRGLAVAESVHFNGRRAPLLHLVLDSGEEASLYAEDVAGLEAALGDRLEALGVAFDRMMEPCPRDREVARVAPDARVLAEGTMWHQATGTTGLSAAWQPGRLYLTDEGLLWWSESRRLLALRVPVSDIVSVGVEPRDLGPLLGAKSVLGVRYRLDSHHETVLFAGKNLDEWRRAVRRVVVDQEGDLP
ncbi:MAG: gas vesicle protein, partial [Acidobacteria bacterium]|nr:gas vesicle protein [Acidobacteriota bacterium]